MGVPRVLPDEDRDLCVLVVAGRVTPGLAEEPAVDPELACLLLRERVRGVDAADRRAGRGAEAATQVVPLTAAAVVEDRGATVGVAYRGESLGDLGDRGVPVDRLEHPVGLPAKRRGQPMPAVLVVVEPECLLARVAPRGRMRLVAAHAHDVSVVDTDLETAVDGAEDAGRGVPRRVVVGSSAPLRRRLHGAVAVVVTGRSSVVGPVHNVTTRDRFHDTAFAGRRVFRGLP